MSELTYERAKQLYTPYDEGQMRHLCALRDVEIDRLRDENAKLRELCKAWREFAYEIFDECFGEPELNEDFMTLDDRMEALGIEVDG